MNVSRPFIERPIGTTLLAIGLFLAGVVAYLNLPVASLPSIEFPTIRVSATLPGADPETMAARVASPLERRLGEIPGVNELTSVNSTGSTRISVQFDLSRNIVGAAQDVQAAINAAAADLPADMPSLPSFRKSNPAAAPILILALTSRTIPPSEIMAVSVVPPPMSTTMFPSGSWMGIPAPMAAAMGWATNWASAAPAWRAASFTARRSTSVMADGTHRSTRGRWNRDRPARCNSRRIIRWVMSKSVMAPLRRGRTAWM